MIAEPGLGETHESTSAPCLWRPWLKESLAPEYALQHPLAGEAFVCVLEKALGVAVEHTEARLGLDKEEFHDFLAHVFPCISSACDKNLCFHLLARKELGLAFHCGVCGLAVDDFGYVGQKSMPSPPQRRLEVEETRQELFELLISRGSGPGNAVFFLARIIAAASMEKRHLWEDLGLPSRAMLSLLLSTYFPSLYQENQKNMRWKKFFYRTLCVESGLLLCKSPSCELCADYTMCHLGPEELK